MTLPVDGLQLSLTSQWHVGRKGDMVGKGPRGVGEEEEEEEVAMRSNAIAMKE